MSIVKRLPDEIAEFLKLEGPQTLLVRGGPGTGKTSLCFEMLHEFAGKKVYVTCRVPRAKVQQDFHWLVGPDPVEWKMLDLTERPTSLAEAANVLLSASGLLSGADTKSEALKALWLPGAIQEAWGETNPGEPALIVIDPWNAFVEQYAEAGGRSNPSFPSIGDIERILLNLLSQTKIHLVFVREGFEESQLDYLVDGVVVANREKLNAHIERWLTLSKLRGIAINRPLYPYTLEGGMFRCISNQVGSEELTPARPEADPSPTPGTLWPGNVDFAREFGRLLEGSMTLFELASEVPRDVPRVLLLPIMAQVLGGGGRVVLIPPPTLSPQDSYSGLSDLIPPNILEQRFRILGVFPNPEFDKKMPLIFIPPSRVSWTKDGITVPVPEDPTFRVGPSGSPTMNLMVVYFTGLEGLARAADVQLTREAIPGAANVTFGGAPVHLIGLGRGGDPYFATVSPLASSHIRVEAQQGRVLLHGFRPFTDQFAMVQPGEHSPYRLIRIN
jgi:KaiC/GvpD/RAD55 family RecA-like ATPase